MEAIQIKKESMSLRKLLSPLKPEKLLRQHAYAYIALLFLTALLIYYYSYPLGNSKSNITRVVAHAEYYRSFVNIGKSAVNTHTNDLVSPSPTINTSQNQHLVKQYNENTVQETQASSFQQSTSYKQSELQMKENNDLSKQNDKVKIIEENEDSFVQPNTGTTTLKPSSAPRTLQPSFSLRTLIPSSAPRTLKPSSAPRTLKPSSAPLTLKPSSAPLTLKPSSAPSTSKPSSAPRTLKPSSAPSTLKPSFAPRTLKPNSVTPILQPSTKKTTKKSQYDSQEKIKKDSFLLSTAATEHNNNQDPSTVNKFLVHSKNCKIPDIDPLHPSILEFVEYTDPLVCKDQDPLTLTDGDILLIDKEAAKNRSLKEDEFFCCYKPLYRDKEGFSDSKFTFGPCHYFSEKTTIRDEFIKAECAYKNETTFYEEYHSFIHDKTHVEERCSKHNGTKYSVLIVGVDSVSRMNMHRQMNKTSRYLLDNMGAFEMYGFNKVGDNTFPNLIPLLTGYDERELPQVCFNQTDKESLDKCNFLWKIYANKGYRTLYAEDSPTISTFNYVKRGFFKQPTDYYIRHFMLAYEKDLGHKLRLNCYSCLGSVSATDAILHWAEQFASHFHDRPYFAFNWINSLTHDYMNLASSGDHFYEQFFRSLHQSGALNRTIVILMGDHGMRWGPIRETYIGRLEERLPMLLIALPPEFKKEFPNETDALRENSHRLVTPFDLHATFVNLLHLKENWTLSNLDKVNSELASNFTRRAQSLFRPVARDRSCDEASIEEHWCTCESSLPMDTDDDYVVKAAKFLINKLNELLKPVSKMCAELNLDTISDARMWSPNFEHQGHTKEDHILTVIVRTSPGMAMFEGTVRIPHPDDNCELLGTVSRLNIYGNQSACVREAVLRKYCYCL